MKHSLADYSMNLSEQAYHDYPAWSYSTIVKYARNGFSAIATLHDKMKTTPEMEFGSLFDSFITKGKKTLDEYIMCDITVPPAEKGVLDVLASTSAFDNFDEIPTHEVINAAETVNYQPKWKPDTRYGHIAEFAKYYNIVKSGKKLVSKQDWDDAMEMYTIFRNDPYLKTIFGIRNTDDVEFIYQAQFCITLITIGDKLKDKEVKVKIMPDLMIVNHRDKTIQLVDLKTSGMPAYDFPEHFVKMRYDIQGELYTDVIRSIIRDDEEYRDYTILPYLFTDISRSDKVPVTYEVDFSNGFHFSKGDKLYTYKGWKQLLSEILVYEANESKVPDYITTSGANDLIDILSR